MWLRTIDGRAVVVGYNIATTASPVEPDIPVELTARDFFGAGTRCSRPFSHADLRNLREIRARDPLRAIADFA